MVLVTPFFPEHIKIRLYFIFNYYQQKYREPWL